MGDIILAQMPLDHIEVMREGGDVIVVEDTVHHVVKRDKAPLVAACCPFWTLQELTHECTIELLS